MAWNLSTGLAQAILDRDTANSAYVLGSTASVPLTFVDNGASPDGITAASGLDAFDVGDWITICSPLNNNVKTKVLTSAAAALTVSTGTLTAEAAAAKACIQAIKGGSFKEIMQNGVIYLYNGTRPTSADLIESGTLLCKLTLGSGAMAFDTSTNGLNMGQFASGELKRGLDPSTALTEVWSGLGLVDGTAAWARWHANDGATGASTTEIRCDGVVSTTTGGDLVMASGRDISLDVPAYVQEVTVTIAGT